MAKLTLEAFEKKLALPTTNRNINKRRELNSRRLFMLSEGDPASPFP